MNNVKLTPYSDEQETVLLLIKGFWQCHSGFQISDGEALNDLRAWTAEGHRLFLIEAEGETVGFLHLGSRGAEIDWLEDLFVRPEHQRQGIGSKAVVMAEELVKEYSESLYIEAAAHNEAAIRLYRRLGYDCLNTITVRKDFAPDRYEYIRTEKIYGQDFEIRRRK